MLKQYEVRFAQAEIEMINDALREYDLLYPGRGARSLITELRLRLNAVLTCEAPSCGRARLAMTDHCNEHQSEARAA